MSDLISSIDSLPRSQKFTKFVRERMLDKPITALPCLESIREVFAGGHEPYTPESGSAIYGAIYAEKLKNKGFDKASSLLGQFLVMFKDIDVFASWLEQEICHCDKRSAYTISWCLAEWCDTHMSRGVYAI